MPTQQKLQLSDLGSFVSQLPSLHILLGDFNVANQIWCSDFNNLRGDLLEIFISIWDHSLFLEYGWSVENIYSL